MKEYLVNYRVSTKWHEPHNTTPHNEYNEIFSGETAKDALRRELPNFSNPNKSIKVLSIQAI